MAAAVAAKGSVDGHAEDVRLRGHYHSASTERSNHSNAIAHNATVGFPTDFYGIDISQPYGEDTFACLKGLNLQFAIIRCYESVGRIDPSCAGSAAAANAAGMDVHAYMFPCPTCGNPGGQMQALLEYWEANQVNVKRLWLDIEGPQCVRACMLACWRACVLACASAFCVCGGRRQTAITQKGNAGIMK
jgi:hypothetical protein